MNKAKCYFSDLFHIQIKSIKKNLICSLWIFNKKSFITSFVINDKNNCFVGLEDRLRFIQLNYNFIKFSIAKY